MDHFMRLISRIHSCAVSYRTKQLEHSGVKGYQVGYLLQVCKNPGISQDAITKNMQVNKSNVARQLAVLQEEGFIYRTQHPNDKRTLQVFPTQKAIDLLPQVKQVLQQFSDYLTQDFTPQQSSLLLELLGELAQKAENLQDFMEGDQ